MIYKLFKIRSVQNIKMLLNPLVINLKVYSENFKQWNLNKQNNIKFYFSQIIQKRF